MCILFCPWTAPAVLVDSIFASPKISQQLWSQYQLEDCDPAICLSVLCWFWVKQAALPSLSPLTPFNAVLGVCSTSQKTVTQLFVSVLCWFWVKQAALPSLSPLTPFNAVLGVCSTSQRTVTQLFVSVLCWFWVKQAVLPCVSIPSHPIWCCAWCLAQPQHFAYSHINIVSGVEGGCTQELKSALFYSVLWKLRLYV